MESVHKAISKLKECEKDGGLAKYSIGGILLQFYKDRSIELIEQLDAQGLMLDGIEDKIGGTD